jgi:serine/threonine protein kinase
LLEERLEYSVQEPRRETGLAEMNKEEKEDFLLLLRSMLAFKPEERISTQQVLESSWVRKWAKPALESLENNLTLESQPLAAQGTSATSESATLPNASTT